VRIAGHEDWLARGFSGARRECVVRFHDAACALAKPTSSSSVPATTARATSTTVVTATTTTIPRAFSGPIRVTPVGMAAISPLLDDSDRAVASRRRCTVLEIGDSLGEDLGIGLGQVLARRPGSTS